MDIIVTFIICFVILIGSVLKGVYIGYPLILSLMLFIYTATRKGFPIKDVLKMAYKGGKKSLVVVKIFLIIGGITGVWMASGTVPSLVFYGMKFLKPQLFILFAFLISSFVSFLIGTSLGTVSTAGLALIVVARGGGVNEVITAGAIISGIYFGDRCSPMSSSASLVATLTETELYTNIKNMFKTAIVPFALAVIFYTFYSYKYPLNTIGSTIADEIVKVFNVGIIVLVPAFLILLLSLCRVNVKASMFISIITAIFISMIVQHNSFVSSLKYVFLGYVMENDSPLRTIMKGGGVISMLKASIAVFISSSFTGIFEGTEMLKSVENLINKAQNRHQLFLATVATSTITAAFGCSQTLSVILTHMLVRDAYEKNSISKYDLAIDLENTAIVISAFIPWNIALLVPLTTLNVSVSSELYASYLYFIPLVSYVFYKVGSLKLNKDMNITT